jgi:hypothetical protein
MDVKALRDLIQELHDSGDCGHMLSDILEMANKICSNQSEANFGWLASALEQYAKGDVVTVPAGTGTEEEFFAWLKDQSSKNSHVSLGVGNGHGKLFVHGDYDSIKAVQGKLFELEELREKLRIMADRAVARITEPVPANKPERITEQDVMEIVYQFADFSSLALPRTEAISYLVSDECRNLLNKLNADRQVPAVAVPDDVKAALARLDKTHYKQWDKESPACAGYICGDVNTLHLVKIVEFVRELASSPTHGQQSVQQIPECFKKLTRHAVSMCFGVDWNNGTAATIHRENLVNYARECDRYLRGIK